MAEWRKEVKVFMVHMACPECVAGEMVYNGVSNPTYPPLVHHECTNCGNVEKYSGKTYPYQTYEEV